MNHRSMEVEALLDEARDQTAEDYKNLFEMLHQDLAKVESELTVLRRRIVPDLVQVQCQQRRVEVCCHNRAVLRSRRSPLG